TGFSIVHCSASAIASENKFLAIPSVIDSIPGKANQEDHVSMCTYSARKARQVIKNTQIIVGVEFILSTQGIDLSAPHLGGAQLGTGTQVAYDRIRETIPMTREDVYQSEFMHKAQELVA